MPDQQVSQFLKQEKVFGFADAVAEAKRDFPKQTADITFIDLAAEDAVKQVEEFAKKAKLTSYQYASLMQKIDSKAAVATEMNGYQILAMPSAREGNLQSFPGDDFKSAYFCFQHELGHFVVKDAQGINGGTGQYKENAADSFAMIRGLQAGVFQKSDLLALADKRGQEMLMTMDFDHMTAMSLDAIAINPKNIDFISLSPKEIAKVAERHASTFGVSGNAASKFARMQGKHGYTTDEYGTVLPEVIEAKLLSLQEIAMSSPAKSQEFYVAARILNNVLETGTIKLGGLEHKVDVNTDHWKDAKKALMDKAGDRDIGGKKAQATVSLTRPEKKSAFARIVEPLKPMKI